MKRTPLLLPAVLAFAALASFAPRAAFAEPTDAEKRTIAEALYAQGTELQAKGDYAAACPKFEEVTRLQPGKIGALMALAGCYEAAGKLASAKTTYESAERAAAQSADPRGKTAHDKAAGLAARIPRLVIAVADAAKDVPGLTVKRDETDVSAPVWGVPIPVDPGSHVISASAPGKKTWNLRTDVAAGGAAVTVTVPALEDLKDAPVAAVVPGGPGANAVGGGGSGDAGDQAPKASGGVPVWAWVSTGLGVAALGVAAGFGVDGLAAQSTLTKECGATLKSCPINTVYDPTSDNARKDRGLAIVIGAGAAGLGALTAGIVGIVTHLPAKAPSAATPAVGSFRVVPMAAPGSGGLVAIGAF